MTSLLLSSAVFVLLLTSQPAVGGVLPVVGVPAVTSVAAVADFLF